MNISATLKDEALTKLIELSQEFRDEADMDEVFKQAKEKPPANFPRDVKQTIKAAWIHPMTPRTYSVTRTGWNKLAEVLSQ